MHGNPDPNQELNSASTSTSTSTTTSTSTSTSTTSTTHFEDSETEDADNEVGDRVLDSSSSTEKAYLPPESSLMFLSFNAKLITEITDFLVMTVEVGIHLTDREWDDKYADRESQEYKDLAAKTEALVWTVY